MTAGATQGRPRGSVLMYSLAFALLLVSGVALAFAGKGFLQSTRLLWFSIALSVLATCAAIASLFLPGRG